MHRLNSYVSTVSGLCLLPFVACLEDTIDQNPTPSSHGLVATDVVPIDAEADVLAGIVDNVVAHIAAGHIAVGHIAVVRTVVAHIAVVHIVVVVLRILANPSDTSPILLFFDDIRPTAADVVALGAAFLAAIPHYTGPA